MNGMRASTAPFVVMAAMLALVLHILQPAMAIRDATRHIADEISAEAFCGLHADTHGNDSPQVLHCKICDACCLGHAALALATPLPVPTVQSWLPTRFARATPARGPPSVQARARAPPALS